MLKISEVKINYENNPVGIDEAPQFSWVLESNRRAVKQKACQYQIGLDTEFQKVVYDSGRIESESSAHIWAEGFCMESLTQYYMRVQVWDNLGEGSGFSETASFFSGVLEARLWEAQCITGEMPEDVTWSGACYLRSEFSAKRGLRAAYLCTTALGLYEVYLNGEKVGEDYLTPGWTSYQKQLLYQVYDVKTHIKAGDNAIGALVGAGWYKGTMGFDLLRNHYGERAGFFAQLILEYEDGSRRVVKTDETWRSRKSPVLFSEIYDGEIYDATLEEPGWITAGFAEEEWGTVSTLPLSLDILKAQAAGRVQVDQEIAPLEIVVTPNGERVIDFGQNMSGWVRFSVKGYAGAKVELRCFEVLDDKGNVYFDNLRTAKQRICYTCKDDAEVTFQPHFTFQGFRYVQVIDYPGEIEAKNFLALVLHSSMEKTGTFTCSNEDLNQLQHNILWGLKGNFVDVPTDCPQRDERLGWTGDAQIFCRTAGFLMNTHTFFAKWMRDLAADQTEEGGVPHVVPDIIAGKGENNWLVKQGTHSAAAWADAAVIIPWTQYLTFGDTRILEDQYESMKKWVDFMYVHAKNNIWNYQLQFGDWVALDAEEGSYFGATPNDLTCTAYYAYSTGLMKKIAGILDRKGDEQEYEKRFKGIKKAFQKHFFEKDGTMTAQTQTAHIVALYFNLVSEGYREKTVKGLLALLKREQGHLVTGFVGTPYFCHALSQNGHAKEAYELLLKDDFPSWLYQVKRGATTIWEHWDGIRPDGTMWSPEMNSFNHYAYGAIGEWLYRVAAGLEIDPEQPGYKHIQITPHIGGGLKFVRASYHSIYGAVGVTWLVNAEKIELTVIVPVNTTATISIEGVVWTDTDGIQFTEGKGDCGSGMYRLEGTIV